ncbi:copper resistance protein CopC [Streptomyces mobaraensis NBRC 13819 = DSM 40847]|uniref:Protein YobA n=1 Tax=Streptomyces mobaraensis (strain ATCC 29032 / DSM 40847 / JCM 4168 / NBRC 13819 / NCIMB 11159 / IPCR 16-22) TaxID=1223523 RepID=M3BBE7_STRM1|nr:copper resistance protein CopC [Streptomyces mobaraensis]EME96869.1 putative integral membrane protein [Streptomyces mobaraensis NBRC 13819 = DSM 40847]QTT74810.1 copper resistance protein CopC [Streptomyces mobaraensis NBRC 13819 = DSM 40847]
MSTTVRRLGGLLGALAAALLCVLTAGAGTASAHAALTATDPRQGSVVPEAPRQVRLTFSEGVLLGADSVRVLDPKGARVDDGRPAHVDGRSETAAVALRTGIANGTYTVAWQAVSADSHPVAGAFTFSVGAPSATTVKAAVKGTDPVVGTLYDTARYAAYAGFALLVGGCVFAAVCHTGRGVRRVAVGGWVALFLATAALSLLRGAYTSGRGPGAVLDLSLLGDALSSRPGAALLTRLLLLSAAAVVLAVVFGEHARPGGGRRAYAWGLGAGGGLVAAGLAATWAAAEHASAGLQPWVAMPVDVLHLLGVGVWLGGLAALLAALGAEEPLPGGAARRFSRLAFTAVCVLVATGIYQAWRQVGGWAALTGTEYGRWLLVKVGLVGVLVVLAAFSRRWTARIGDRAPARGPRPKAVPEKPGGAAGASPERAAQLARQRAAMAKAAGRRERAADEGRSGLRRAVLAEAVVAVVLLAVTTVLTTTQPGRAETEQKRAGRTDGGPSASAAGPVEARIAYDTGGKDGRGTARVTVAPGRSGTNTVDVTLTDPAGRPVDVPEVAVSFTEKEKGIGPLRAPLKRLSAGRSRASGFQLPMAGRWQLTLTVRTSEIDQVTEIEDVKID